MFKVLIQISCRARQNIWIEARLEWLMSCFLWAANPHEMPILRLRDMHVSSGNPVLSSPAMIDWLRCKTCPLYGVGASLKAQPKVVLIS